MSARSANLAFHFNSRPSARGDSKVTALYNKREVFQFTPLREGRPCRTRHPRLVSISIHAPPRGATEAQDAQEEGRKISIHAPPRGATAEGRGEKSISKLISIHAPPRGATDGHAHPERHTHFNSRPSARGDRRRAAGSRAPDRISIHAPPRGATRGYSFLFARLEHFNSRPSARGD